MLEHSLHNDQLPEPTLAELAARLAPVGLNAWGIADGAPWQDILPGCRSVLVLGSGGPTLWQALNDAVRADQGLLDGHLHPLDDFVARAIAEADPSPPPYRRWLRCAGDEAQQIDFRSLAQAAGLGHPSRLGLLLHPEYGPWLGLRAACFSQEDVRPTGPLRGLGPCLNCPAPCMCACPGNAVPAASWGRFSILKCSAFRKISTPCRIGCDARRACPEGAQHAYDALELHYHQDKRSGRVAWRRSLRT